MHVTRALPIACLCRLDLQIEKKCHQRISPSNLQARFFFSLALIRMAWDWTKQSIREDSLTWELIVFVSHGRGREIFIYKVSKRNQAGKRNYCIIDLVVQQYRSNLHKRENQVIWYVWCDYCPEEHLGLKTTTRRWSWGWGGERRLSYFVDDVHDGQWIAIVHIWLAIDSMQFGFAFE